MEFVSLKAPNCIHYLLDGSAATFENGRCKLPDKYEDEMLAAGFSAVEAPKPAVKHKKG